MTIEDILTNLLCYENEDASVKAVGHYINMDTINVTIDFVTGPGKHWNLTMKKNKWLELRDKLGLLLVNIGEKFNEPHI